MVREWELQNETFSDEEGGAGVDVEGDGMELAGGYGNREGRSGFDFHAGGNDRADKNPERWWKYVFGTSVRIQDASLRVLQDRIVLGANIWAAVGTVILTVSFLIPEGVGLF